MPPCKLVVIRARRFLLLFRALTAQTAGEKSQTRPVLRPGKNCRRTPYETLPYQSVSGVPIGGHQDSLGWNVCIVPCYATLVKYILFVCFVYVITCLTYVVLLVRCKLLSDSCMKKARPDKASRQPLELRRRAFIRGGLVPCNETVNDRVQQIVDPDDIVASPQ